MELSWFAWIFLALCSNFEFSEKARLLEGIGAKGAIVIDNNKGTTSANTPLFAMSGDGTDDVSFKLVHRKIVVTLLSTLAARNLSLIAHTNDITYQVAISECFVINAKYK